MTRLSILAALTAAALIAASGTAPAIGKGRGNGASLNGIRANGGDLVSQGAGATGIAGVTVIAVELPARIDR